MKSCVGKLECIEFSAHHRPHWASKCSNLNKFTVAHINSFDAKERLKICWTIPTLIPAGWLLSLIKQWIYTSDHDQVKPANLQCSNIYKDFWHNQRLFGCKILVILLLSCFMLSFIASNRFYRKVDPAQMSFWTRCLCLWVYYRMRGSLIDGSSSEEKLDDFLS